MPPSYQEDIRRMWAEDAAEEAQRKKERTRRRVREADDEGLV